LYDPARLHDDTRSAPKTFEPNETALMYSMYHKELTVAPFSLKDGMMPSGLAPVNNDGLSRRDRGIDNPIQLGSTTPGIGNVTGMLTARTMVTDSQLGPTV